MPIPRLIPFNQGIDVLGRIKEFIEKEYKRGDLLIIWPPSRLSSGFVDRRFLEIGDKVRIQNGKNEVYVGIYDFYAHTQKKLPREKWGEARKEIDWGIKPLASNWLLSGIDSEEGCIRHRTRLGNLMRDFWNDKGDGGKELIKMFDEILRDTQIDNIAAMINAEIIEHGFDLAMFYEKVGGDLRSKSFRTIGGQI